MLEREEWIRVINVSDVLAVAEISLRGKVLEMLTTRGTPMKILLLGLLFFSTALYASDYAKEKRWIDEVVDSIIDGEEVMLKAGEHEFLAIYTEAEEASRKGMIVVHGTGIHPNWDQVIRPIRVEMTAKGWNTLSIQMPILQNGAEYHEYIPLYPEVAPRLQAAEKYLLENGSEEMVIVAHSQGATMSSYYLAGYPSKAKALVAIGMPAQHSDKPEAVKVSALESLKSINIPVLDLYGSGDLPSVLESVAKRQQSAAHNKGYTQQTVAGANHFFDGKNAPLLDALSAWLAKY